MGVFPVVVRPPGGRRAPLASAAGVRPRSCLRGRGFAPRVRSPRSATVVTAPVHGTPRRAWRASTPGAKRPVCTGSWRACARRRQRSGWAVPVWPEAGPTIGGAGGGPPTARRQRRWAGLPWARPVERLSGRSPPALSRRWAACRARRVASRARRRSRRAAASTAGTDTGLRSPERLRLASGLASRRSVGTRSPAGGGIHAGATTPPTESCWASARERPCPPGPAS